MKPMLGLIVVGLLVIAIYIPPMNNFSLWSWQVMGIPIRVLLWLFAPILAAGALFLIIPKSPRERAEP